MLKNLIKDLENLANPEKAKILSWFFKTWVWQYWEWDKFYWITVPEQRKIVKKYLSLLDLNDIEILLNNPYHEQRLVWVLLLVEKFKKADKEEQTKFFEFYIKSSCKINNWDLVDRSSPNIVGKYLINKDKTLLYEFAVSSNLWQKRINVW